MSRDAINSYTYKGSGVDVDAGATLVEAIAPSARATKRAGTEAELGGFGALFDLKAAGFRDPVLVAATDGVGTKLNVANAVQRHDTIGIDLVAMCVNDLAVQGAEPLFFLDYLATGKLDVAIATEVISGISAGCRIAGCALIGGETAEMPGMYGRGDYELAGFAVGAGERDTLIDGGKVRAGDVVLGLASTGLHANGFSLIRQIVRDSGHSYHEAAPFAPEQRLGDYLLTPTRIYVQACLALAKEGVARAFAHITGGGLVANVPRQIPPRFAAVLDAATWPLPAAVRWFAQEGRIAADELAHTFNCGIGLVAIVAPADVDAAVRLLEGTGETVWPIGHIALRGDAGVADSARVTIEAMDGVWRV